MTCDITFELNQSKYSDVVLHLTACDASFFPRLSERVVIADYAKKIIDNSIRIEAWVDSKLIGLVAVYKNNEFVGEAFVTSVSVEAQWRGKRIAERLMTEMIAHVADFDVKTIKLQVHCCNVAALRLYQALDFVADEPQNNLVIMKLRLN